MKQSLRKTFKIIGIILVIPLVALLSIILVAWGTDYRPDAVSSLSIDKTDTAIQLEPGKPLTLVTFNIGYGGLGKNQDFFMDGGTRSGADSQEEVINNMRHIKSYITDMNPDFALFQEVDISGKRSHNINQYDFLKSENDSGVFAKNLDVTYVPVPFQNPMGGAVSGLLTLSKTNPLQATRIAFDGKEPFIKQLFDLKRAFSVTRYPVSNGKEFVLINAHFSAFDAGGSIRKLQISQMKRFLTEESAQGNYIILGGDFNHELPSSNAQDFEWTDSVPDWIMKLPEDFIPEGMVWAIDRTQPTVRAVESPYVDGKTFKAIIDGFVVSENITIHGVNGHPLNFENSDHNPVTLSFSFK